MRLRLPVLRRLDLLEQRFDFFPQRRGHLLLLFRGLNLPVEQQLAILVVRGEMFLWAGDNDQDTRVVAPDDGLHGIAVLRYRNGGIISDIHYRRQRAQWRDWRDGCDGPRRTAGLGGLTQGFL